MTTIDIAAPPAAAEGTPFDGIPRRVGLTLPELTYLCAVLGAPVPFEVAAGGAHGLDARLGQSRSSTEHDAYSAALASLGAPEASLRRRGLIGGEGGADPGVDPGVAGALGLLATPSVAVELDVTVGGVRARAWHRHNSFGVAALATVDGLVFELSWLPVAAWATEIARAAELPEDISLRASRVPDHLEVPFTLADAALEAIRSGRSDLVPVLTGGDATLTAVLTGLGTETRGRLRVLVASAADAETAPIGVVSWVLVADGWRALRPAVVEGEQHLLITRVEAADLAAEIAPVLAEVTR